MLYKIPIIYQSCIEINVEAKTLEEAVKKALQEFLAVPDDNYLEDSFEIDNILDDEYPDEEYDINKIIQEL